MRGLFHLQCKQFRWTQGQISPNTVARGTMNIILKSLIFFLFPTSLWAQSPDCIYTGRGEVYDFKGNHLPEKSFQLHLERYKSAPGEYYFNETKLFPDGSQTNFSFGMGWFVGPFSFENGSENSVQGRCLDYGYCVGKTEFPGFKGTFVTRFDNHQILTTTTTDEIIVDEVVHPASDSGCPFN